MSLILSVVTVEVWYLIQNFIRYRSLLLPIEEYNSIRKQCTVKMVVGGEGNGTFLKTVDSVTRLKIGRYFEANRQKGVIFIIKFLREFWLIYSI